MRKHYVFMFVSSMHCVKVVGLGIHGVKHGNLVDLQVCFKVIIFFASLQTNMRLESGCA